MRTRSLLVTLLLLTACQQPASSQQVVTWSDVPTSPCASSTTYGLTAYLEWGAGPAGMPLDGYVVERQKDQGEWHPLPLVAASTTRIADGPLDPGAYHWQVRTQATQSGEQTLSAPATEGTPAPCLTVAQPPPQPSPLTLRILPSCGVTCVVLGWTGTHAQDPGALPQGPYTLERWIKVTAEDLKTAPVEDLKTSTVQGTSTNDPSVRRGKTYCYHIAVQGTQAWSNEPCTTISP